MLKKIRTFLGYLIPAVLAMVLLFFVFKKVDLSEFWSKSAEMDYKWVIVSIIISTLAYIIRAYRWNLLLHPIGHFPKLYNTTLAVIIGYLANLAFPRIGEITRCGILKRTDQVPISIGFGSVITERLVDFISLILLTLISLFLEYEMFLSFLNEAFGYVHITWGHLMIGISILLAGFVGLLILLRVNNRIAVKIRLILVNMRTGFLSLRDIKNLKGFLISTVLLWTVYYAMTYVIIYSLPETASLPPVIGLLLLVASGIALSIPVQGGFGTYHILISSLFVLYGVDMTSGLFLATALHGSQLVAVAIFGGVSLFLLFFSDKRIKKKKDDEQMLSVG